LTTDNSIKLNLDEDFYGDQDFDMDELDADGFSGLGDIEEPSTESEF